MVETGEEMHKYTQTVFHFEDGYDLRFVDPRKFGAVWLVEDAGSVVGDLGPEPLEPSFTAEVLGGILEGRGTAIKSLLMDQRRIAGIGNIYADDILFRSGVHPMTRARDVEMEVVESIHESIVWVLSRAIDILEKNMPVDAPPTEDLGPMIFLVPREKGVGCPRCSGEIERMVVGGRGDVFLPRMPTEAAETSCPPVEARTPSVRVRRRRRGRSWGGPIRSRCLGWGLRPQGCR